MNKSVLQGRKILLVVAAALAIACSTIYLFRLATSAPIRIGILHSLTGYLALSEKPMVEAELLAIEEINARGGILKRKIIPIVVDGKSDETVFAQEAERLIKDEHVSAILGCWTSASRKAVTAVVEKYNNLLIFPLAFEGIEESRNVLFTGTMPNQQILPGALWSLYNLGARFFLVGSDEVFSRTSNEIIKNTLTAAHGDIVGEEYVPLGSTDVTAVIEKIIRAKPDVIINTLQGDTNHPFFEQVRANNITPEKIPIMSIGSVSETEFGDLGLNAMAGDYICASYFQSIESDENIQFITNFKKRYGSDRVVSDSEETGYISVYLWAKGVQAAGSAHAPAVIKHLNNRVFNAPEGIIYTDNTLLCTWKMIYIGKLRSDGQFTIVWDSKKTVQPVTMPLFKTKEGWKQFLNDLYVSWGNQWSKNG